MISIRAKIPAKTTKSLVWRHVHSTQVRRISTKPQLAHSSWFKLDDQGMKDYELLARGSAFYVRGPSTGMTIALVSAHVAAPHRFRTYFPQGWLQHVRDSDCRSLLETRSQDGKQVNSTIMTQPLVQGFRHASLDVAAFLLKNTEDTQHEQIPILNLPPENHTIKDGDAVTISGFRLIGESGSGTEAVIPSEIQGVVSETWNSRVFVDTADILTEMGMCGGPAVSCHDRTLCIGILEGLVPEVSSDNAEDDDTHKRLQNKSVLVGAKELRMFLHDVETEAAKLNASFSG